MKTILVATDFSPAAFNAVNYAADMAIAIKADLLLLHVYQIPVGYSEIPIVMNQDEIRIFAGDNIKRYRWRSR